MGSIGASSGEVGVLVEVILRSPFADRSSRPFGSGQGISCDCTFEIQILRALIGHYHVLVGSVVRAFELNDRGRLSHAVPCLQTPQIWPIGQLSNRANSGTSRMHHLPHSRSPSSACRRLDSIPDRIISSNSGSAHLDASASARSIIAATGRSCAASSRGHGCAPAGSSPRMCRTR